MMAPDTLTGQQDSHCLCYPKQASFEPIAAYQSHRFEAKYYCIFYKNMHKHKMLIGYLV